MTSHFSSFPPSGGGGQVHTLGLPAAEALASARTARWMGRTSRGLFLGLDTGWIVFLSAEPWRGPLTLNLGPVVQRLPETGTGDAVSIEPGRLVFPGFTVCWESAERWEPPPAQATETLQPAARRAWGQALAQKALRSGRTSTLSGLLPLVWRLDSDSDAPAADTTLSAWCQQATQALAARDTPVLVTALRSFAGLGSGLTPSGDDLILGFLLALARWGAFIYSDWPVARQQSIAAELVAVVHRDSTALSASLAACAARGQADERLVQALDGLVTGQARLEDCAACLAGWGNSSGFDALVGMGLLLGGPQPGLNF